MIVHGCCQAIRQDDPVPTHPSFVFYLSKYRCRVEREREEGEGEGGREGGREGERETEISQVHFCLRKIMLLRITRTMIIESHKI